MKIRRLEAEASHEDPVAEPAWRPGWDIMRTDVAATVRMAENY